MTRTLAIANQKGGVGKTVTTKNVADALAARQHRVLVIDLDPQANLTTAYLAEHAPIEYTTNDLLANPSPDPGDAKPAIVTTLIPNVDLIPSELTLARREADSSLGIEARLRVALRGVTDTYDYVLIDCPPAVGKLLANALLAADGVLLVTEPAEGSIEGLTAIMDTIHTVRRQFDHPVDVAGVVINKAENTTQAMKFRDALLERYGPQVLAVVRRRAAVPEAYTSRIALADLHTESARDATDDYASLAVRLTRTDKLITTKAM